MNRESVLLNNALCWIYEHCYDLKDYEDVLRNYMHMTEEEVRKEMDECQ